MTAAVERDAAATDKKGPELPLDTDKLKRKLDVSHFDLNAVLRGMQLTLVGAQRALQNPGIFTNEHYKQAAAAVIAGLAIRLFIYIPAIGIKVLVWILSFVISEDSVEWSQSLLGGLHFIENHVLQIPFFLMALMRYIVPTLDNLFMQSLEWVDLTYVQKHRQDNPKDLRAMYYPTLKLYHAEDKQTKGHGTKEAISIFLYRYLRKGAISLAVFGLSYLPVVGRFVLPAASFFTFNKAVGLGPAAMVFGTGIFLPRRYLVIFLQSYFASRSLVRELLQPYFARIPFTREQKRAWFRNREGVLFGFGLGFYAMIRVPLVGVLVYGIAEASAAYLITKISEPPPTPENGQEYAASEQTWKNKQKFLSLPLHHLDFIHDEPASGSEIGERKSW